MDGAENFIQWDRCGIRHPRVFCSIDRGGRRGSGKRSSKISAAEGRFWNLKSSATWSIERSRRAGSTPPMPLRLTSPVRTLSRIKVRRRSSSRYPPSRIRLTAVRRPPESWIARWVPASCAQESPAASGTPGCERRIDDPQRTRRPRGRSRHIGHHRRDHRPDPRSIKIDLQADMKTRRRHLT